MAMVYWILNTMYVGLPGDIGNGDLCLDSVVNCIQSSSNRQTHQQALLVLSAVAKIAPASFPRFSTFYRLSVCIHLCVNFGIFVYIFFFIIVIIFL